MQRCENCKYYHLETVTLGFVCVNDKSFKCADWVESDYCCEYFEEKENDKNESSGTN